MLRLEDNYCVLTVVVEWAAEPTLSSAYYLRLICIVSLYYWANHTCIHLSSLCVALAAFF